jgi:hypothetical protein
MFFNIFKRLKVFNVPFLSIAKRNGPLTLFLAESRTFALGMCPSFPQYYLDGLNLSIFGAGVM